MVSIFTVFVICSSRWEQHKRTFKATWEYFNYTSLYKPIQYKTVEGNCPMMPSSPTRCCREVCIHVQYLSVSIEVSISRRPSVGDDASKLAFTVSGDICSTCDSMVGMLVQVLVVESNSKVHVHSPPRLRCCTCMQTYVGRKSAFPCSDPNPTYSFDTCIT